jgi:hypothetical protein
MQNTSPLCIDLTCRYRIDPVSQTNPDPVSMTDPHHGITFRIEYGWIKITMGAAMQIALPMCIDPAFRYPNRIPIRICFTGIRFTYRPNKRLPVPEPASEALNQPPWSLLRLWNLLQKFSFRIPRSH